VAKLTIRIDLSDHGAIGPGKIRLLELVGESGSISAAGRAMNMSYRRAWMLIDNLNRCFRSPVVETQLGGTHYANCESQHLFEALSIYQESHSLV